MTFEDRMNELEDTVIRLSYVLELKTGAYSHDGNSAIRDEGQLIEGWARAVQERRAGTWFTVRLLEGLRDPRQFGGWAVTIALSELPSSCRRVATISETEGKDLGWGREGGIKVRQMIHFRPRRLGLRTAQAARLAKKLNDAADGRLVAYVSMSGELVVDPDLLQLEGLTGLREIERRR
jgi:hypothetical protein